MLTVALVTALGIAIAYEIFYNRGVKRYAHAAGFAREGRLGHPRA